MGFAGQIFAARVAVGLAVPSSQALSSAGQTLANGVGAIYGRLNKKRVEAAKLRQSQAEQEMNKSQSDLERFRANAGSRLRSSAQSYLADLDKNSKAVSNSVKNSAMSAKGLMASMQTTLTPKLSGQLMAGVDRSMSNLQKAQQMTKNFLGMKQEERKMVMDVAKQNHQNAKQAVEDNKREAIAIQNKIKAVAEERDEFDKSVTDQRKRRVKFKEKIEDYNKEIDRLGKTAEALLDKDAALNEVVMSTKDELNVMKQVGNASDLATKSSKDEESQLERTAKAKRDKYNKVSKETTKVLKESAQAAAQFGRKIASNAQQLAGNFANSLRDTIAIMTAFYYKLSQNTQELIAFERELMNANSVFQVTRDELFQTSNQIVQFGQEFGLEMQNGATGLYQLASAGLSADEAMQFLPNTLKLSMAVQGDHNTIAKLTTQTIAGFGMEAADAAEVTDKFAHAIQKSLIEYEDLSSAVKFALPFFTSTGQSIDQLLGALQVLTNRALEAGIAGRGLRQALAEFAEGAEENSEKFREMGIDILDSSGNMKQLTDIAMEFKNAVGKEIANDTELLTTLIDKLNVRGATAFVHLVQNAEEFKQTVDETANAGGELDKMIQEQNASMMAQIQILKNNIQMMFFHYDGIERANGAMNEFHSSLLDGIESLQNLFVTQENGQFVLTTFGQELQNIAVRGVALLTELLKDAVQFVRDFTKEGMVSTDMLKLFTLPLKVTLEVLQLLGPNFIKMILYYQILNKILPISIALESAMNRQGMIKNGIMAVGNKFMTFSNALLAIHETLLKNGIRGTYQKIMAERLANKVKQEQIMLGQGLNFVMTGEIVLTRQATKGYLAKAAAMAAAALPYIAIAAGIALVATSFAIVLKETDMLNFSLANIKLELMAAGAIMMHIFEEQVFPLLYRIGLEWIALSAILAFAMIKIGTLIYEKVIIPAQESYREFGMVHHVINGIIGILKFVGQVIKASIVFQVKMFINKLETAFDILGELYKLVTFQQGLWETIVNISEDIIDYYQEMFTLLDEMFLSIDAIQFIYQPFRDMVLETVGFVGDLVDGFKDLVEQLNIVDEVSGGIDFLKEGAGDLIGGALDRFATGGYVRGMSTGGMMGTRRPYIVGERGPELFMPSSSGQIINNTRTDSIMRQSLDAGPATKGGAQELVVSQLVVGNAKLKNTRMAVDSFAGVV